MGSNKFCAFDFCRGTLLPPSINQVLYSLPVCRTIVSSLAEPIVDANEEQQAPADNSVGAALARAISQVVKEPNPNVSNA